MPHSARQKQKIMIVFHQLLFALSEFFYPNRKKFGLEIWCQLTRAKPMPNPGFHKTPWVSPTLSKPVIYPCQPVKKSWVWEQSDRPKIVPIPRSPSWTRCCISRGGGTTGKTWENQNPGLLLKTLGIQPGIQSDTIWYDMIWYDIILYCIILN